MEQNNQDWYMKRTSIFVEPSTQDTRKVFCVRAWNWIILLRKLLHNMCFPRVKVFLKFAWFWPYCVDSISRICTFSFLWYIWNLHLYRIECMVLHFMVHASLSNIQNKSCLMTVLSLHRMPSSLSRVFIQGDWCFTHQDNV